ncbi:AAA family ATPase [Methanomicrobium sp. W14]|uniref:AAA family ATPase n=1 Tax=Methanomicrobium sp. W14 TaxID=2817839 RepID=UPI003743D2D1
MTLKNVASYKTPVNVKIDKKINLFYGLNGSGKTTISNFLQNPNLDCFCDCNIADGKNK